MLVLTPAHLELPLSMEFAKSDLKLALQVNSGMDPHHHAKPVNILALNALLLLLTVLLALPA